MDRTMEQEDCIVEMVCQPNQKKLKQARLPFQTLSSLESPKTMSNKKRKLSSLSPINQKNEKIAKKENVVKKDDNGDDDGDDDDKSEKDDNLQNEESLVISKKIDEKSLVKSNALTRFLQKGSLPIENVKPQKISITESTAISSNCNETNDKEQNSSIVCNNANEPLNNNASESDVSKVDESSNERIIHSLRDSVKEEDENQEKLIAVCGNNSIVNSDSESDPSLSEDDDNDDDDDDDGDDDDTENSEQKTADKLERMQPSDKNEEKSLIKKKRLTPRQLEKKMEMKKKQEERQKLRAEREKQRVEEKMKRRQEREAEKEQKRKEKEQKELKKQMEIEQKQKEKERKERAREEDRRKREEAKEEEKRRKEEEKLELERKKQKAASTFVSFFVPKKQETKPAVEEKVIGACNFMPFEIKANMKMAPICRRSLNDAKKLALDAVCFNNTIPPSVLYLEEIKNDKSAIHQSGKTWLNETKDDVVILDDDDVDSVNVVDQMNSVIEKNRPKLLLFAENRRPPYWGTWRKKSSTVNGRKPFGKDIKWFDYEIDSDEEWEEEEPGESLRGSDDEKDEENPDDDEYDVDNEFMVPHGYLSDEEARADGEDEENMSPEIQKVKLKILGEQFEAEMNEKTAKIKPKIIGCIWQDSRNCFPESASSNVVNFLTARQAWVSKTPRKLLEKNSAKNI